MIRDADLAGWNTFGVPCRADWAAVVADEAALFEVLERCASRDLPVTVLGGGSNVVLRSRLPGCALRFTGCDVRVEDAGGGHVRVTAGAGMGWHDLVRFCLGQGLYGLENLALIPGTVGAAPVQNIGAYGVELDQRFHSATVVDRARGTTHVLAAEDCGFSYRDSAFKGSLKERYVITAVTLLLSRQSLVVDRYPGVQQTLDRLGAKPTPVAVAEAVTRLRRRKLPDPRRVGNAGSFFKNPTVSDARLSELRRLLPALPAFDDPRGHKIPAAALIEACGFRGSRFGRVGVWPRHALVLTNLGGATGDEILQVAGRIADKVDERFDLRLEIEPQVLGVGSP